MNKTIITLCLTGAVLAAGTGFAQDDDADAKKQAVRVCTLNSVRANQEFQRNVRLVQNQRQLIAELKVALNNENDAAKRTDLQKKVDDATAKLLENNKKMTETYGFSLTRNYIMVPEKSHVYMLVSAEEAKKFEDERKKREGAGN